MSKDEIIQDIQSLKELEQQQNLILDKYLNKEYDRYIILKENLLVLHRQMITMLDNVAIEFKQTHYK